jgi:hypothetical protein
MWRMLCERSQDLEVVLVDSGMAGEEGWAHWTADYTFTDTGRRVHNDVRSQLHFDGELIAKQIDSFSLRRWGGQALGRRGTALGSTGLLGPAVRRRARGQLDAYRS